MRLRPKIAKRDSAAEFLTPEGCYISETWHSAADQSVSVARARVEPAVTTALHYLEGVVERYLIVAGQGRVEVGGLAPSAVGPGDLVIIPAGTPQRMTNIGEADLIFYCICTPRFTPECYHQVAEE